MKALLGKKSLRVVLITPFMVLIILSSGVVGTVSFYNGRRAVSNVAGHLQHEISARIEDRLRFFLTVPQLIVRTNADNISRGMPSAEDSQGLELSFRQQLKVFDSVTSIYFGNTRGGLANSGREPGTDQRYVMSTAAFRAGLLEKYALGPDGERTTHLASVPSFDARTRPWYIRAVDEGRTSWSPIYILSTGQDMAIACSHPVHDTSYKLLGVVSVDVFLSHISHFLQSLKIGENGQCLIFDRSGLLIASTADRKPFTNGDGPGIYRRMHISESSSSSVRAAVRALNESFNDYRIIDRVQMIPFELDGNRNFLQLSPLQDIQGLDWLIGVVVAESDFMSHVNAGSRETLLLIAAALFITITIGLYAARRITTPISQLHASALAMARGEWPSVTAIDTPIHEIDGLALSFDHMAAELRRGMESLSLEVAERTRTEVALREREENYRVLFDSIRDAIFVHLIDEAGKPGRFVQVNEETCRRLGYSREELLNMNPWDIGTPETAHQRSSIAEQIKANGSALFETVHVAKDGRCISVESNVRQLTMGDKRLVLSISRDITERKQAEEQRIQLARQLQQAQKAESLGRMAGAIAHHFNNMLGAVIGNLELSIMDSPQGSRIRANLSEALAASLQAAEMSRFMHTYLGQTVGRKESLDLADFIEEKKSLVCEPVPKDINIKTQILSSECLVCADGAHLTQILIHLVLNAIEAIGDATGEIILQLREMPAQEIRGLSFFPLNWKPRADTYACISVSDTGCGLEADQYEKIFDPFFSTKIARRGLGLSVTLGLVRAMDGAVGVESQAGQGAAFHVFLPLAAREEPARETGAPSIAPKADERRKLILLVDDEVMVRNVAHAMLKHLGYEALPVSDGLEAVKVFQDRSDDFSLVILDLNMPGMNGWETLTALRAMRPDIPVILSSGYDEAQVMADDHPEQPQSFLHKPYQMADMRAALRTISANDEG